MQQMDPVLLPYLQSTDESESERLLNDLLYDQAALTPGQSVVVRFAGVSYRGRLIRKAGVERQ